MSLFGGKSKKKTVETSGELVVNFGKSLQTQVNNAPAAKQQSLDALFAISNNMWVCEKCETLNEASINRCIACGNRR